MGRDGYSNFGFYTALRADLGAAAVNGETLDLLGYETATVVVTTHSLASGGAMAVGDAWKLVLYHGLASAAGVSAWSLVPLSQIIHSVEGGYDSTASDGVFEIISSAVSASGVSFEVGYKKDVSHRYLRVALSISGAPSAMLYAAVAILGRPGDWPINEPIND